MHLNRSKKSRRKQSPPVFNYIDKFVMGVVITLIVFVTVAVTWWAK